MQCKGTTLKGQRCKIQTESGYCRYHANQSERGLKSEVPKPDSPTSGYIYIYTMSELLNSRKLWLQTRNLPNTKPSHKHKWKDFDAGKSPYMLVKVGMTLGTVARRLAQWQNQCHHDITVLGPATEEIVELKLLKLGNLNSNSVDSGDRARKARVGSQDSNALVALFKKLQLSTTNKSTTKSATIKSKPAGNSSTILAALSATATTSKSAAIASRFNSPKPYSTFRNNGFFCGRNLKSAELEIHRLLRAKYGNGDILCTGCATPDSRKPNKDVPFRSEYNIHVEWFLVPKSDLEYVYLVINSVCLKNRI